MSSSALEIPTDSPRPVTHVALSAPFVALMHDAASLRASAGTFLATKACDDEREAWQSVTSSVEPGVIVRRLSARDPGDQELPHPTPLPVAEFNARVGDLMVFARVPDGSRFCLLGAFDQRDPQATVTAEAVLRSHPGAAFLGVLCAAHDTRGHWYGSVRAHGRKLVVSDD